MIPNSNISSKIRAKSSNYVAEDCNESSGATSSSLINNWWPSDHHHDHVDASSTSLCSWSNNNNNNNNPWNPQNPNSNNSSGEEDVSMSTSFTNASNHSGLTVDSSHNETPSAVNHLWNHVLLSIGNNGELHNNHQDVGDNMVNSFAAKNISTGLFEPACDYLKKMDNGWELTSSTTPFNNFSKNFDGFGNKIFEPQGQGLTKLSNIVSNWSIAPPDPEISRQFDPLSCNISLSPSSDQYTPYFMKPNGNTKLDSYSSQGHDHLKSLHGNGVGSYEMGMNNVINVEDFSCKNDNGSNLADVMSFTNCLNKPWIDINASMPILKSLNLSDCKKQALQASYTPTISPCNTTTTRSNRKGQVLSNEGKKKRCEDNSSHVVLKKPKHDISLVSSVKASQIPKAKLGDKITALQQIVSPFGKTDTASVLWEAIGYIKFLQEQVQLLSNPYMKTNAIKEAWGGLDRKERGEFIKVDLKSRGLCLVPVSCTPQAYRDNIGPDYLTPAYRGCLYR